MKLKIAFQMDPISDVDISGDTSFRLAEEGQKRGHEIYYFNPESLVYETGNIIESIRSRQDTSNHKGIHDYLPVSYTHLTLPTIE